MPPGGYLQSRLSKDASTFLPFRGWVGRKLFSMRFLPSSSSPLKSSILNIPICGEMFGDLRAPGCSVWRRENIIIASYVRRAFPCWVSPKNFTIKKAKTFPSMTLISSQGSKDCALESYTKGSEGAGSQAHHSQPGQEQKYADSMPMGQRWL